MKRHSILVPLDGSLLSEAALPYAVTLASAANASVELLAVVDTLGAGQYADRLQSLVAEGLRTRLHTVADSLRARGLMVETAVREGDPADVILVHAEKLRCMAVVMTTRGLGGLDRWLIGGVADKVMRQAPCAVLVVRPAAPEDVPDSWRPTTLLVPVDGSELAEQALDEAYRLAQSFEAEVRLVRVQPWLAAQLAMYGGYVPDVATIDEQAAQAAQTYVDELAAKAPAGVRTRAIVLRGDPADRLITYAETEAIDLVVMASHGRGGMRRFVLGSVADRIIRGGMATYIVHPVEAETATAAASGASSNA